MTNQDYIHALLTAHPSALNQVHEAYRESQRAASMMTVWRATIHLDDTDPNADFGHATPVDTKVFINHADACAWAREQLTLCAKHHNVPHFSDITEEFIF